MATKIHKGWTDAEDRILIAGYAHLTTTMLAEDLGRTRDAVESRIRKLRARGWDIRAMPRGRGRSKLAEQARAKTKPLELSLAAERDAMRDEVQAYLAHQVLTHKVTIERATEIGEAISRSVLNEPEHRFKRYCQKSVMAVVADFL